MKFERLKNKLALVTGGASGIGAATVDRLVEEGLRVIVLDQSEERLQHIARSTQDNSVISCVCNLADLASLPTLCQRLISVHGPISYLVNNAGVWPSAPLIELSRSQWELSLAVNVTAPFLLTQGLAASMQSAGGGAIVNVASRNAFRSSTKMAAYDAAKAAMVALTRTGAGELARSHIRINAVCPGVIDTPGDSSIHDPIFKAAYTRLIPLDRYGQPSEIASVIAFLLSDEAAFITGQTVIVDGGQIACQDNKRFMEIPHLATCGSLTGVV